MKTIIVVFSFVFVAQLIYSAPSVKHDQYKELTQEILRSQPEEYKNKKVCYESVYNKYMTTFPSYAERNGFKAGKYYWLVIQPNNLPVIVKKTKDMNDLILILKRRSKVKVYGKVRKFKLAPKHTMFPVYYLELADIQVIEEPKAGTEDNDDEQADEGKKRRPRWRRRMD